MDSLKKFKINSLKQLKVDERNLWNQKLILEFLDHYSKEPVIWYPYHRRHNNRDSQSLAWRRIQSQMSVKFSIRELKRKKDTLMARYRYVGHQVRKAQQDGHKNFKPTWFPYAKMEKFLKRHVSKEVQKPHVVELEVLPEDDVDENFLKEEDSEEDRDGPDDAYSDNDSNSSLVKVKNEDDESYFKSEGVQAPASSSKKRKTKDTRERDEIDLFVELLRSKMRRMDEKTRDVAMNKIDNLMFEIKMEVPQEQRMILYESLVNVDNVTGVNPEKDEKQD